MSDSVFTPEQEARIIELIRELLPEITQVLLDQLTEAIQHARIQAGA